MKVTGDMMISFPTAVVQRLASHTPSTLPPLSLQIVHANELEHVLPNTHLLKMCVFWVSESNIRSESCCCCCCLVSHRRIMQLF